MIQKFEFPVNLTRQKLFFRHATHDFHHFNRSEIKRRIARVKIQDNSLPICRSNNHKYQTVECIILSIKKIK